MPYTNITNPLDLEYILVNSLAGSMQIFFFLMAIFLAYIAAKLRMPNQVFLIMMSLFIVFMANYYSLLYTLLILLAGLFIYYAFSKIPKT